MESDVPVSESAFRIREKIDLEQWVFEHKMEMTRVQAMGLDKTYESMLNSLIISLSPYWDDEFRAKWVAVRSQSHPDPRNTINDKRREEKEMMLASLMDKMEIGFTKKKKMHIKGGLEPLFRMFPPWSPSNEPSSKN